MARILAIDYGLRRTGIAVTDPLQLIANGLTTVETKTLISFLQDYLQKEEVEKIIVGEPRQMDYSHSQIEPAIRQFIAEFKKKVPGAKFERFDERFTSRLASQALLAAGYKKKDRRNKELVDKVSATIILQSYLEFK
ncbi:MAG: Holliday junction resolvase RuvX [Bacteroidia bacterium]